MKTVKCIQEVQNFTKGKSYKVKNYDYGMYSVKGDNGRYAVVPMNHFTQQEL